MTRFLDWSIEIFYRQPWKWLLLLCILGGGIWAHNTLETEAYPEFAPPTVRIITLARGKGAEEVERLITIPLEKELNAIPNEVTLRSISILGLSVISITFTDDSVQSLNRQQVLERIAQADIPPDVQPALDPNSGSTGEIYRYTLESNCFSPMTRKSIEDWQLERAFKQIPGVIDVVSFGGPTKTFQVNIDAKKLVSYGIQLTQVFTAIQNSNGTTGGNYIENNGRAYVVRGLGLLRNVEDIERVVVSSTADGTPIRIKDIAKVDIGPGIRLGQFGKNKDDDAIMGIVLMRRGENASKIMQRLYSKFPEIQASLPAGIKLVKLYDRQELVNDTMETVSHNVVEGIFLVVVVLIIFLFDLPSGLITAVAIPLSICTGWILLNLCHISANLLSLGAIDFGIIVDGAVVMVENAFAQLSSAGESATREEKRELVLSCAKQVGAPILFSVAIIMVTFLPIFSFQGVAGKLFRPLAFTMNFLLVGAIISALFIIPSLVGIVLARRNLKHVESPVIKGCLRIYQPVLNFSLQNNALVVFGAIVCLAITGLLASRIGSEFLPALDEGNIWVRATVLPTSVSLEEAVRVAKKLREIIATFPEVENVTSQTGSPDDGTDPNLFSNIELFVDVKPMSKWRPEFHGNKHDLIVALNDKLEAVPNVLYYFSQYIQDNVDEAVAGAKGTLAIKVYGPDIKVLQRLGDQIASVVNAIPGLVDVANTQQLGQPEYQIAIDRDEASRYGVNVSDVQNLVETAVGGRVATKLLDGEKRFPVLVRLAKQYRDSEKSLDNILIDPPGPIGPVPLSELASIKHSDGAAFITRENNSRVTYVRVNLRGKDLGTAVKEAQEQIAEKVKIPEGYKITWAGQYEFQQEANQRLMIIAPVTLLLIYLILLAAFRSHKNSLLIMCAIPLAALGGVSALLLTGTYFSISAAVGFIALSGVAVQNGVILISHINHLRKTEGLTVTKATRAGALDRMRPVLMTATVAMLGLLPAATSNGIGAQSQKPFAIVIIGGLISATVLTLIVLPSIYLAIHRRSDKDPDPQRANNMTTNSVLPLIAAFIFANCLSGCTKSPAPEPPSVQTSLTSVSLSPTQKSELGLQITPAKYCPVDIVIESTGRVQPNSELSTLVSTPAPGRAVEVMAKLGDVIQAGQTMAVIKSDAIGQVQSDLLQNTLQARADITQQKVQLKLSHITQERESLLYKEQVSAKADLQTAENQLEKDEANLDALESKMDTTIRVAQERLTMLGAPPDSAKMVIAKRKIDPFIIIRAPRAGVVIDRTINPGEMNDGSKPLFTLAVLSEVWLVADIFEKDILQVKKGQEAYASLDSEPNKPFAARIVWVGASVNPATRTLPVRANVANPNLILKPGMFARLKIDAGKHNCLRIPRTAIIQKGDETLVFVETHDGTYKEREITTGIDDANYVEVKSGLKEGERVVSQGGTALLGVLMKSLNGS